MSVFEIVGALASVRTIFSAGVAVGKIVTSKNNKNDRH